MGVTIEQYYRARIGARNNVRIKVDSTQLEGNFCDTMLNVDVISVGNNNYYINYIDVNILPECNLFANKKVDRTI